MDMPPRNPDREALVRAAVNNSPYYKHVAMRVVEFTAEGSVMEMEIGPRHLNVWGAAHGGALSSLADSSCGTAIGPYLGPDETVVTLDLRVQFMKPARAGLLTARGRVVHRTRRQVFTECEIRDPDGDLVARGSTIHTIIVRQGPAP